jgi:hypothetical protein
MVHGGEAEELRAGIEKLIALDSRVDAHALQHLLDHVDARDSLAFLERRDDLRILQKRVTELEATLVANREVPTPPTHHGLDTDKAVCFYEQEFYPLSNFSAFTLQWCGIRFDTSEAAYHWEKFRGSVENREEARLAILAASSAHAAFQTAQRYKNYKRRDWDDVKVHIMRQILWEKVEQHEYVRRKLLETGSRMLVENSWRDDFWGWGERRDGKNMLGVLWMEIRTELRRRNLAAPSIEGESPSLTATPEDNERIGVDSSGETPPTESGGKA